MQRPASLEAADGLETYAAALEKANRSERDREERLLSGNLAGNLSEIARIEEKLRLGRESRSTRVRFGDERRRELERRRLDLLDENRLIEEQRELIAARNLEEDFVGPRRPRTAAPAAAPAAGAPASDAAGEAERLAEALRARIPVTEASIEAEFRRRRELLAEHYAGEADLLRLLEEERDEKLADLAAGRAGAAAEAAAARAERIRASGIPALHDLREETARLADIDEYSREAVERSNRARERQIQIAQAFPAASEDVRDALAREYEVQDAAAQLLETKIGLLERYNAAAVDQSVARQAAEELRRSGDFDNLQADAALANLNIAAGDGSFADGWIFGMQRMRAEAEGAAAGIGQSFAGVFGPSGSLAEGFAASAAAALTAGESMSDAFGRVARQAVRQLIADLVRAALQALIVRAVLAAFGGPAGAAAPAVNTAALSGGTTLAGAGFKLPGFRRGGAFDRGGVIEAPTLFGFGRDNAGVAGEAGPEAILPLARDGAGNLGVRAAGAGERPVNVTVVVHARDAADFDTLLTSRRRMIADMVADALATDGGR